MGKFDEQAGGIHKVVLVGMVVGSREIPRPSKVAKPESPAEESKGIA